MDESNEQREMRARDLAIEEGRRRERVDGQLNSHELRLNAINGSIERGATATANLKTSVDELRDEIHTKNAVDTALHAAIATANEKQISTRAFTLGVLAILIPMIVLLAHAAHV